jgi:putative DNA primase/helicase
MTLNEFMKTQATEQEPITAPAEEPDFDEVIPEGQRNSTMSHIAGRIIKRYGNTNEAKRKFAEKAAACNPPLDPKELQTIWSSAIKFGGKVSQQDGYIPPEDYNNPTSRKPADYSDLGQAYAFAKFCRDYVRYSPATDYIVYNGIYWEESKPRAQAALDEFTDAQLKEAEKHIADTEKYMETTGADAVVAEHGKNAAQYMNEEQLKAYLANTGAIAYRTFVIKHRDSKYLAAALKEARPMVEIDHHELNKDGFLLNTPDYTVDLRKGADGKLPHRAEDFITKCTAVAPGIKGADIWEDALNVFFCGDTGLKSYVQRIAGLCAIGHVYIEALIIAYGEGRNGKSTFWNSIARVLGSYSGHISADALTVGCHRNVKPELAETNGVRALFAAELEEGLRLNTSVAKQLSSTDEIYAEKKYKDPFSFTPCHTLILYTNHLPKVGANDPGTWRRLIVVPFSARIEGNGDHKNYADYLFENAGEAILSWIIEGAKAVIDAGFHIEQPECVRSATSAYRENSDWLGNFIYECCDIGDGFSASSGDLYTQYRYFCQRVGDYTRSTTDFYTAIEFAGFTRRRTRNGRFVDGLRLKSDFENDTPPLV